MNENVPPHEAMIAYFTTCREKNPEDDPEQLSKEPQMKIYLNEDSAVLASQELMFSSAPSTK